MAPTKLAGRGRADVTFKSATPPVGHLMTLYQRYDSLRNSIALLREQTIHTPGIEDWPSVQTHYANLLSHTFSIAAALQSASPNFLTSQFASLSEFFETEAQDANLFGSGDTKMDALFGHGADAQPAWPPIEDKDTHSQLPFLAVHPCQSIPDNKLNWLGTLLSTVPETEVAVQEMQRIATYDRQRANQNVDQDSLTHEIKTHDARCLQAIRSWYHNLYAPDEDGETYDFTMRVQDEPEDDFTMAT